MGLVLVMLVFSMLSNNYVVASAQVKALENRVAVALSRWDD